MAEFFNVVLGFAILGGLIVSPYFIIKWLRAVDRRGEQKNAARLADERQRTVAGVPGKPERSFLKSCTNCGVFGLTLPFRDKLGRTYCSAVCMKWLGEGPRQFCKKCTFETSAESSGNLQTINGIGATFIGQADPCGECASVIRRVWITILFVPVFPLRKYRVLQVSPQRFFSRRLRPQ